METKENKKPAYKKPSFYIGIGAGFIIYKLISIVYDMIKANL